MFDLQILTKTENKQKQQTAPNVAKRPLTMAPLNNTSCVQLPSPLPLRYANKHFLKSYI